MENKHSQKKYGSSSLFTNLICLEKYISLELILHRTFLRSISRSFVSKAFFKSIKIISMYFPPSKPLLILSVNNDKQEAVKTDLRGPD